MPPQINIQGLSELTNQYSTWLVDQFGTLHDGKIAYPSVFEAMLRFRANGGKIAVLTNSAKSGTANFTRLSSLGFKKEHLDILVTSGDIVRDAIRTGTLGKAFRFGAKIHISGKPNENYGFEEFGFIMTKPDEAEGIILAASREPERNWNEQVQELSKAATRGVSIAVCNSDLEMMTKKGIRPSAGAIARELEYIGAKNYLFGKPNMGIYFKALTELGNPPKSSVLAIGDSPEHDIAGAISVGIDSVLLRTGILTGVSEDKILSRLQPTFLKIYCMQEFRW